MNLAIPNAGKIGFTGTPLFNEDEITRRVFGDYVSTYDFQRAVDDQATVPLYYDARGDKLGLAVGDLNQRMAEAVGDLEIDDVETLQRLERELQRDYHIITARSAWTRSPATLCSTTPLHGNPARLCWCASIRSLACACINSSHAIGTSVLPSWGER